MRFDEETGLPMCMMDEGPEAIKRYWKLIEEGESPGIASITATKMMLSVRGDTSCFSGETGDLSKIGGEQHAKMLVSKAEAAGISTRGKVYNPTMAGERGAADPDAWIQMSEGYKSHARRVCEKNGTGFEELGIKANGKLKDNPVKDKKLADHLANRLYREAVSENPDLARRPRAEVTKELVDSTCM